MTTHLALNCSLCMSLWCTAPWPVKWSVHIQAVANHCTGFRKPRLSQSAAAPLFAA